MFIILAFLLISFSYLELNKSNAISGKYHYAEKLVFKILFIYISFFLFLLTAFRYNVGTDWPVYYKYFCNTKAYKMELGFKFLNNAFESFFLLQLFCSIITCLFIYRNIQRYSVYPILTLTLYYLTYCFEQLSFTRQYLAIGILCVGIPLIEKKQFFGWIIIVAIATLLHSTALLGFPLYFTLNRSIKKKFAWLFLFTYLFLYFFGKILIYIAISFVLAHIPLPVFINDKLVFYIMSKFNTVAEFSSGLGFLLKTFVYCIIIVLYRYQNKEDKYNILNFLIAICLSSIGRNFLIFARLAIIYLVCGNGYNAYALLFTSKRIDKKLKTILFLFFFLLLSLCFFKNFWDIHYSDVGSKKLYELFTPFTTYIFDFNDYKYLGR